MPELEARALPVTRRVASNQTLTDTPVKETESPNSMIPNLPVIAWILDTDFIAKADKGDTVPELEANTLEGTSGDSISRIYQNPNKGGSRTELDDGAISGTRESSRTSL